ncbi:MAG TPA: hypothetical protein VMY76_13420 [Gemmatimonadales bacterium]|nr:hypothetical protein [Gemmatimonadales bacterium]
MSPPLVVKFGGDALAVPERIAAAAHRVALRRRDGAVVAVASARRGVTDHLLGLVEQTRTAAGGGGPDRSRARAAADRAVASGELVAASLLAVALGTLGLEAVVLDAREAGLLSDGHPGDAALTDVRTDRLNRLLERGVTPVVTGFQGWHLGRLTTLGRGGSDITAIALAAALGASECELVKDPGALHTADPRLVPEARPIARTTHRFATELAVAGARVFHPHAAEQAEREGVALRFSSLHGIGEPSTTVTTSVIDRSSHAVVLAGGHHGFTATAEPFADLATVTVVTADAGARLLHATARVAASRMDSVILRSTDRPHATAFLVRAADGAALLRGLHAHLAVASHDAIGEVVALAQ